MSDSVAQGIPRGPSGRWQASFWHDGQRHTGSDTFTAKADALAYLANTETDLQRGQWIDPAAGKVTLSKYATEWLDGRSDLRETTRAKYDHLLKNHILPKLGSTPISSLAPSKVRSWYQELARRHSTTADDARLLRAVLNVAKADRQIGSNPCQVKGAGRCTRPSDPLPPCAMSRAQSKRYPSVTNWRCSCRRGANCVEARFSGFSAGTSTSYTPPSVSSEPGSRR